ncbi:MAG: hypothetical protein JRJ85_06945 [Deltaproteobacteria bacterium]|nr:hypothetical protein [Deltaproteobacteria bacterium]
MSEKKHRIAFFVSPHGYGHAARAAAVMDALHRLDATAAFEIFTKVPRWFFEDSLPCPFHFHAVMTDIGLVQSTPLEADISATVRHLNRFLPFDRSMVEQLAKSIRKRNCRLIVCDIAPLGIAVAREAGIPSVLIENFTWDWLYEEYAGHDNGIKPHIRYLRKIFTSADYHIQTEPVCDRKNNDLNTRPISRVYRESAPLIRKKLGFSKNLKMVLITMGGIPDHAPFVERLNSHSKVGFIIPGGSERFERRGNVRLLPMRSDCFHPDLVRASDAVIGKVGYSTLAEIYHAGVPFGYIRRDHFRESDILVSFIKKEMQGLPIHEYYNGEWVASLLPQLLDLPKNRRRDGNGAGVVAEFICHKMS